MKIKVEGLIIEVNTWKIEVNKIKNGIFSLNRLLNDFKNLASITF